MEEAIWIIAIIEIIRMVQNTIQLVSIKKSNHMKYMDKATTAFVSSLKKSDESYDNYLKNRNEEILKVMKGMKE